MFKQLHKKYLYPTNNSNVQPNIQQNASYYEGTFNKATTTSTQLRLKSSFQNLELYKWTDKDGENKFDSIQEILINSGAILDNKFFEIKKEEIKIFKDQIHYLDRKIENIENGLYHLDQNLKASNIFSKYTP